jgi:hypothetical protein
MGRKKKEPALTEEPGNVLDGVVLLQQTPETWAVQFRFQGKPCSKLLYGTKQTASAVRELVAIWLCYKASDPAVVATELQQLQHGYEHYSFLIEALRHSRSVEALWKVVGKFCRGEFEIRSALRPGQPRASADESTGRSPAVVSGWGVSPTLVLAFTSLSCTHKPYEGLRAAHPPRVCSKPNQHRRTE